MKWPVVRGGSGAFWAAIAAMAVVTVGYTIHQIWMCLYRKMWHEQRESVKDVRDLIEKESKRAKVRKAIVVWEYFAHSKHCEKGLRDFDKRSWYFVHSLMSASIACAFGSLIAVVWGVYFLCRPRPMDCTGWKMVIIAGIYGVLSYFFCWRGSQAKVDVVELEVEIIERAKKDNIIERIIRRDAIEEKAKQG